MLDKSLTMHAHTTPHHTMNATTWEPCTEERFWEQLGCLPPAFQSGGAFLMGEPYTHRKCKETGEIRGTYQGFREFSCSNFETTSEPVTRPEFIKLLQS